MAHSFIAFATVSAMEGSIAAPSSMVFFQGFVDFLGKSILHYAVVEDVAAEEFGRFGVGKAEGSFRGRVVGHCSDRTAEVFELI